MKNLDVHPTPDPREVANLREENNLLKIEVNMLRWGTVESPLKPKEIS